MLLTKKIFSALVLWLALTSGYLFIAAHSVQALIGSHLGYGDVGTQVEIMGLLKGNGAENGFPVTLMVDISMSEGEMGTLAAAVKKNSFFPIVRINHTCGVDGSASIAAVNRAKAAFGSEAVIVFDNEINHPEECSDWNKFTSNYRQVKNIGRVSPAAMDFYMGIAEYQADKVFAATGLRSDYQSASFRAANAYGCMESGNVADCNPLLTTTHNIGLQLADAAAPLIPSSSLYITEFSLNPNGGDSSPDTSLDLVRTFIEVRGPQTGAVHITPLVRNVCGESSAKYRWLVYLHGDFFYPSGEKVTPGNCPALKNANPYGQTAKDPNLYYLYPLILDPKLSLNNSTNPKDTVIANMVLNQGYQVYHLYTGESDKDTSLNIRQFNSGSWGAFYSRMRDDGIGTVIFGADDDYIADLTQARVPMYRGNEPEMQTVKSSSFEGFFGANSPSTNSSLNSGVISSLTSVEQQCQIKLNNLQAAKKMCETLGDYLTLMNPDKCALHQLIPSTNYYIYSTTAQHQAGELSLLNDYEELGMTCQEIANLQFTKMPAIGSEDAKKFNMQLAFRYMPFNLDRVYRWAFLVVAPKQDTNKSGKSDICADGQAESDRPDDPFCFLYRLSDGKLKNASQHAPMFIGLKIPDFGTNKSATFGYLDSGDQVGNILTTVDQQTDVKAGNRLSYAQSLIKGIELAREAADHSSGNGVVTVTNPSGLDKDVLQVRCDGMPMCACADFSCPVRNALTDIINGAALIGFSNSDSPRKTMEKAGDIYTPANSSKDDPSRVFYPPLEVEESIMAEGSLQEATWHWNIRIYIEDPGKNADNNTRRVEKIGVYLVSPFGYDVEYLNEAIRGIFFTEAEWETNVENNVLVDSDERTGVLPEFYPLKDAEFGFESSDRKFFYNPAKGNDSCPTKTYTDEYGNKHEETVPPCSGPWDNTPDSCCVNDSVVIELDDHNDGLFVPGAKLGWMIRKTQEFLHSATSEVHQYLLSCDRAEDLFLGRCDGDTDPTYGPPDGVVWNGPLGSGNCEPIEDDNNPCSMNNLYKKLKDYPGNFDLKPNDLKKRAIQASIVCNAESGGNPNAFNDGCLTNQTVDYSVGLFQINLLAHHCPQYFDYSWEPPDCDVLVSESLVKQCQNEVADPDTNIAEMLRISGGGESWGAWGVAKEGYCGPVLDTLE